MLFVSQFGWTNIDFQDHYYIGHITMSHNYVYTHDSTLCVWGGGGKAIHKYQAKGLGFWLSIHVCCAVGNSCLLHIMQACVTSMVHSLLTYSGGNWRVYEQFWALTKEITALKLVSFSIFFAQNLHDRASLSTREHTCMLNKNPNPFAYSTTYMFNQNTNPFCLQGTL